MNRKALGRGLDALIPHDAGSRQTDIGEQIQNVPIELVQPNRHQPRKQFDDEKLAELSKSIRDRGVLEPLLVRPAEDGRYELIAGERRLRAAQLAGKKEVPVILRQFSGRDLLEIALIENLQRENLNPVDEARAYQKLVDQFELTHAQISEEVGKERSTVTNLIRLLRLPEDILALVSRGTLSVGHARVLLSLASPEEQIQLAEKMIQEGWSVRQAEELTAARDSRARQRAGTSTSHADPLAKEVARVQQALRLALGTEVHLTHRATGGKIEIRYGSQEELERILELIGVRIP
jgi:ParB family transcriptional regulator, chromosome partitioning protein